jgi:hypothetical protein
MALVGQVSVSKRVRDRALQTVVTPFWIAATAEPNFNGLSCLLGTGEQLTVVPSCSSMEQVR